MSKTTILESIQNDPAASDSDDSQKNAKANKELSRIKIQNL